MKLLPNKAPAPTTTGVDILREATRQRIFKGHASQIARDLNIGIAALDGFGNGSGRLPDAVLDALAKNLFGSNVSYDAELNLLRRAERPAQPMLSAPLPYVKHGPTPRSPAPPIISEIPPPPPRRGPPPGWAME